MSVLTRRFRNSELFGRRCIASQNSKIQSQGLILSIFPGLDMFSRAFEAAGWCVVRGPDLVFAHDIRDWHTLAGRFDGVIGGPPCQAFSRLMYFVRHNGDQPKFGNLTPEFERIIAEAEPHWWLMEQVPAAPIPYPQLVLPLRLYEVESFLLSPRDLGDPQSRQRRFTFGQLAGERSAIQLHQRLPLAMSEHADRIPAVTSHGREINNGSQSWAHVADGAAIQGYPELAEHLRGTPFTARGACQLTGNGVPRVMGEALANGITKWWGSD